MTVRQLAVRLLQLPDNIQDMPAFRFSDTGYVPATQDTHPLLELGMFEGRQFMVAGRKCYPTTSGLYPKIPDPSELTDRITVFCL